MIRKLMISTVLVAGSCWMLFAQTGDLASSIKRGNEAYTSYCQNCHQQSGAGLEGVYPPLAKSDFVTRDKDGKKSISVIIHGQTGEVIVNGKKYNIDMPNQAYLTDEQIADILNYVRNSWGNKGKAITPALVKTVRK
jgi:mono/diheme cytochrome c family protein